MALIGKITKKSLFRNKDARVLMNNFISLSTLRLLGYIFPLVTLPYLARVIGVDKFGEIAYALSIVIYFQTIVDFGFNYTAVRDMARCRSDIVEVSKIFSKIIITKSILMILSLLFLTVLIFAIPSFYNNRILILLTFLYIPGTIFFADWFFQAMEEMKYITILNLLSQTVFTLSVFIVIKDKADYIFQPILIAAGYLVSGTITIILIFRKYKVKLIIPTINEVITTLKINWNMFTVLFFPNLYSNFSIVLLKSYFGSTVTGLYSSGSKFIDLAEQLSLILSRTFYPFLARRLDKHNTYVLIGLLISVFSGLCLFFGADLLVMIFYTDDFSQSARVIRIMSISPFFLFLMHTYGPNYLVLIGKENVLRNIVIFCSLGGFILTWLIIPKYSFIGVAITLTIVWGLRGLITWFFASKYKKSLSTHSE